MILTAAYDACPLCNAKGAETLGIVDVRAHKLRSELLPGELVWQRCQVCSHIHTADYFTPAGLAVLYANVQHGQMVGDDAEFGRLHSSHVVRRVRAIVPEGRWLDVGIGNGALVLTASEFGYAAHGIDPRSDNITALAKLGIEGTATRWEDYTSTTSCNVISMADVIEHMAHPVEALARAAEMLAPGGALFISTPNVEAPFWKLMSVAGENPYWTEIEHHHVFGRTSLHAVLSRVGLEVVDYAVSERFKCGMELIARKAA